MKKLAIILAVIISLCGLSSLAMAASSNSHSVTVTVNAINEAAISGGPITLTDFTATAGSDLGSKSDSTTCDLLWTTNESSKKITAATSLASPTYTLKVLATGVTGGTAAAEVTLSTTATTFVTGITKGSCDLTYTAVATAAQGTGTETHTITYTVAAI